jgi:hypothetical protein
MSAKTHKRKLLEERSLHEAQLKFQKTFHSPVPNRMKNNLNWIQDRLETANEQDATTPKTVSVSTVRVGSTTNVKSLVKLLQQRSEHEGYERLQQYDLLITKLSPEEIKEFAQIVKGDKLYLSFLRLNKEYNASKLKVKEKTQQTEKMLQELPKLKKFFTEAVDKAMSILEDCPEPIQQELLALFNETFKAKEKEMSLYPLHKRLSTLVHSYDDGEKALSLTQYENKIAGFDQRIQSFEMLLQSAEGENITYFQKEKTKAVQEKIKFQEKHTAQKKAKSVASKEKVGWGSVSSRRVLLHEEFHGRGLKTAEAEPSEAELSEGDEETTDEPEKASLFATLNPLNYL